MSNHIHHYLVQKFGTEEYRYENLHEEEVLELMQKLATQFGFSKPDIHTYKTDIEWVRRSRIIMINNTFTVELGLGYNSWATIWRGLPIGSGEIKVERMLMVESQLVCLTTIEYWLGQLIPEHANK